MASFNRVILLGNLTRDPELTYTPSNTAVCKFGLAANRRWKDQSGETRETVCFVDCTLFGRGAETFKQYMAKGRSVLVEGRLDYQSWTAQDGTKRSKHEVIVESFQFVGGQRGGEGEPTGAGQRGGGERTYADTGGAPMPSDDDIPF